MILLRMESWNLISNKEQGIKNINRIDNPNDFPPKWTFNNNDNLLPYGVGGPNDFPPNGTFNNNENLLPYGVGAPNDFAPNGTKI